VLRRHGLIARRCHRVMCLLTSNGDDGGRVMFLCRYNGGFVALVVQFSWWTTSGGGGGRKRNNTILVAGAICC